MIKIDETGKFYDRHWAQFIELCSPCLIDYDFIGKLENLDKESMCVLHRISSEYKFPKPGKFGPSAVKIPKGRNTKEKVRSYFKDIPRGQVQALANVYRIDCEMFGYNCTDVQQ